MTAPVPGGDTPERSRLVARAEPFTAEQLARLESIEAREPVNIAADVAEAEMRQDDDPDWLYNADTWVLYGPGSARSRRVVATGVTPLDGEAIAAGMNALAAMPPADEALRERVAPPVSLYVHQELLGLVDSLMERADEADSSELAEMADTVLALARSAAYGMCLDCGSRSGCNCDAMADQQMTGGY